MLAHDGGYTGTGCRLCLCPESRIGFFVACNIMDGRLLDEVSRTILDLIIPAPPQDTTKYPLTTLPQYDGDISEFTGTYRYSRYSHNNITKSGWLIGMSGPELSIWKNEEGMILMPTYYGKPRRMIQIQPRLFQSIDDSHTCAFRRDASGKITHLLTDGTAAFEKISLYETASFQRNLLAFCLIYFMFVSVVLPIVRKIRKTQKPSGLSIDPVRWFSQKMAATFLLYILGFGIVMVFIIPQEELMIGFAHGMHWAAYIIQTVGILGILLLAGLLGVLFRRPRIWSGAIPGERARAGWLDFMNAIVGLVFVWSLWYWNLVGYQF